MHHPTNHQNGEYLWSIPVRIIYSNEFEGKDLSTKEIPDIIEDVECIESPTLAELVQTLKEKYPDVYANPNEWLTLIFLYYRIGNCCYYADTHNQQLSEYFYYGDMEPTSIKVPEAYKTEYDKLFKLIINN